MYSLLLKCLTKFLENVKRENSVINAVVVWKVQYMQNKKVGVQKFNLKPYLELIGIKDIFCTDCNFWAHNSSIKKMWFCMFSPADLVALFPLYFVSKILKREKN